MVNKIGKADSKFWILLGILVIALLHSANVIDLGSIFGTEAVPDGAQAGTNGFCAIEDTTYTFTADDIKSAGTDVGTASSFAIFVDGVKKDGTYSSGDSLTLSPGSKVELYHYDATSTHSDGGITAGNTKKFAFTVPCKGVLDDTLKLVDLGGAASTAQQAPSSTTITVLDDTYTSIKGTTTGYAMSTGQSKKLGKLEITYDADKGYGSPDGKLCLVMYSNRTVVKDITVSGNGAVKSPCRPSEAVYSAQVASADYLTTWSWEMNPITDESINLDVGIELKSGDGVDPVASDGTDDIVFEIYDQQWFYNADNGLMELGYTDENGVLLGAKTFGENITLA